MTTLHFPAPGDWLLSGKILDDAIKVLESRFKVSYDYHVPYLAGYSVDGKTIYIDSRLPESVKKGFDCYRYIMLHECVEKILLLFFKNSRAAGKLYQLAHQMALRLEESAVTADHGAKGWKEYNSFMAHWIKMAEKEGYDNLPPDLDDEPYEDEDDKHAQVEKT
jgi:hypothetical protein